MTGRISRRAFSSSVVAGSLVAGSPAAPLSAQRATPVAGPDLQRAIAALPDLTAGMMQTTGVPGVAVAVVHNDEAVYLQGFGEREVGTGTPVGPDTVFQIASISKSVSSTIVAAVVGNQEVSWDTRMVDILPGFALSDPWVTANVTIADLFSHRSGLPDHVGDDLEDLGATREQVLESLRYVELAGEFRDSYAYTNFGLTAAAEGVANALGMEWHELAQEMLFAPAGMTQSSYLHSEFSAREDRVVGHVQQGNQWVHAFDRQPDAQAPAGGVSTSVRDLTQWMRLQMRDGVLDGALIVDDTALGETHLPHVVSGLQDAPFSKMPSFYGLGWNVGYDESQTVVLSHSGAFMYGAATSVYLWPSEDLGIVVLTNGEPVGLPEALCLTFHDIYRHGQPAMDYLALLEPFMEAMLEPPYGADVTETPASPEPPRDLAMYAGAFWSDVYGALEMTVSANELVMTLGPAQIDFQLMHFNRDVFTYEPIGENSGRASAVTFTVDATGRASQVVIENLNLYNAGTFGQLPQDSRYVSVARESP